MSDPTSSPVSQPLRGVALVLLATFLFAGHDALSKHLGGLYPVVMVVWARYLVHSLLMAGLFLPRAGLRGLRTQRPLLQGLRALSLLSTSLLFTTGLQYVPLAEATAVNFLAPVLVTALSAPLLKERVSLGQWLAVAMGFVGVVVIVHPGGALFTPAILFPLGSAMGFCAYQVLTRILAAHDSPTTSNFLAGVCNTLVMSLLVPFFWQLPGLFDGLLLLALGTLGMAAHLFLTQAFRHAPAALLAPFGYCQIVFAGLLGYLLYAHAPDPTTLVGIGIVCLSGLGAAWLQRGRG